MRIYKIIRYKNEVNNCYKYLIYNLKIILTTTTMETPTNDPNPEKKSIHKTCYISAFYDLKRENWIEFSRTFDTYLKGFEPIIKLFLSDNTQDFELIVYIDKKHIKILESKVNGKPSIRLIGIDEEFMRDNLPMWKTLNREREIMNSEGFKNIIPHRLRFPETHIPEYTLINHCKIDFICHAIDTGLSLAEYYCWVDFGYCSLDENIPKRMIDISKLNVDKINYTLINPIDERDKNIIYTLVYAPERIGGFFFFGSKNILKEYQSLYHKTLEFYQGNNLCDDDQALSLACYWQRQDMFHLHYVGAWHKALVIFQLDADIHR